MASLTVLRRRVTRWRRYADRAVPLVPWGYRKAARGHGRAVSALAREMDRRGMLGARYWPADDVPACNVHRQGEVCYCTRRPGCPFAGDDPDEWDDEPDDDAGHGDGWGPVETVETGGLL